MIHLLIAPAFKDLLLVKIKQLKHKEDGTLFTDTHTIDMNGKIIEKMKSRTFKYNEEES